MVRFVLFGFKCEDGFEFRGRSVLIERRVLVGDAMYLKRRESM